MSELLTTEFKTQNVFELDPAAADPANRKAILAMQATGLYVADDPGFEAVNQQLHEAAAVIGKPPTMTYEDLVFTNPFFMYDIPDRTVRVLSRDPLVAHDEAVFYAAHREIEIPLYQAINSLRALDGNLQSQSDAPDLLERVVGNVRRLYHRLDPKQFAAFRPFFVGINSYPGPSGLYSESIPILDLLVHGGSNIAPEERRQMLANIEMGLYPNFRAHSVLFRHLLETDNPQLAMPDEVRGRLSRHLNAFRRTHRESVKKFVPGAMQGRAEGSGGVADVAGYLAGKVIKIGKGEQDD